MSKKCSCPASPEIPTVPTEECEITPGKDARWIFQRLDDANNTFVNGVNGIEEESSWTLLPVAADGTKVAVTPYLEDVNYNEPDVLEDGETFGGAPNAVASGPQLVTAIIRNPTTGVYNALKQMECEKGALTYYRVDANGNFIAREEGSDHVGIKIEPNTFVVKEPSRAGAKVDEFKLMIQFYLPECTYGENALVEPEAGFDPLTEIKP